MNLNELADDLATKVEAVSDAEGRREAIKAWLLAQKQPVLDMYEAENEPIVRNRQAPGDLAVGDYVFASRWGDCDPGDPWAVGRIADIRSGSVAVGGRFYPYARRISFEQGDRIVEHFPRMEKENGPLNYHAIAAVFGTFPDD